MGHLRRVLRALLVGFAAVLFGAGVGAIVGATPAAADTSAFSYDSWHVDYRIGTDSEGRAIAEVTETLVARFPDFDQNRGIVRGLPIDYEGASTDPRDFSVTDGQGAPVPFEIEDDGTFVAVLVGDDSYVHGVQTYVIEYTLSDVILARDDQTADEFYWDLVDFEHLQPIESFSAAVSFAPELASRLTGAARCYVGGAGSTEECQVLPDGPSISIASMPLGPRQGVTLAVGLDPGSVTQPAARIPNFLLDVMPLVVSGAGLLTSLAGAIAVGAEKRRRRTARGTVVAQYEVPRDLPPLLAGPIVGAARPPVPAEIVHLAVNGVIRIEETAPEQKLFASKRPRVSLRLLDPQRVGHPLDSRAVGALFPSGKAGATMTVPRQSETFAANMRKLKSAGDIEALRSGYLERKRSSLGRILGWISLGILAVLAVLLVIAMITRGSPLAVISLVAGILGFVFATTAISKHRMHTPRGAEAREFLLGVREFIKVAEADRLRTLQSYSGAERRQDGTVDVIHLYERLLPYAMLFGLEKEWGRTLEATYAEHGDYVPLWYPAMALHGVSGMSSTLAQFTTSLSSSVSYTSSSSGGSSGGGFAGGGGGGGFSGGR